MHIDNPFKWKNLVRNGRCIHECVGAVIKRDDKYLLVERRFPPFGFGLVGGHMDKGEYNEQALTREIFEEIGAHAKHFNHLFDMEDLKRAHFKMHFTHIYSCEIDREPKVNYESKSYGWFGAAELATLQLTDTTRLIFIKLGVLQK